MTRIVRALAALLLVTGLAASGVVGALTAVGNRPLVGLDGHQLTSTPSGVPV